MAPACELAHTKWIVQTPTHLKAEVGLEVLRYLPNQALIVSYAVHWCILSEYRFAGAIR